MISRTSFIIIAGFAATFIACAGAPRERAVTTIPVLDGAYEFSGVVPGVGVVAGLLNLAPDGRASVDAGYMRGCTVPARINERAVSVDCSMFSIHAFHQEGELASKATVRLSVWDPGSVSERRRIQHFKGTVDLRPAG